MRRALPFVVTVLAPFALLASVELLLLLVGVAGRPPLFVETAGTPGLREVNPDVARRFVVDPDAPRLSKVDTVYFEAEKPKGSFRIFVQGGSTAAGFPYGRFAGLAGMLEQRLSDTFPELGIEVVTTAMSAVNSYTLLDFADEILAEQPDLVLVYAGHNEYLGFLGVGSTVSAGRSRVTTLAFLRLQRLRLFQLLRRGIAGLRGLLRPSEPAPSDTVSLMGRVAGEKEIPWDSPLYHRGREQFRANLGALLARYRERGVPVMVGTLASNERDQPPFVGKPAPGGDPSDSADVWFARGRELESAGRLAEARDAYRTAVDRDQLRFRAPQAMNDGIRALAERHGAVVVDVQGALAARSPGGILGSELLLEHLHPNVRGYFLLADAYYDAMRERGLIGSWEHAVPDSVAWRRQPVSRLDEHAGAYRIAVLKAHWPFQPEGHEAPLGLAPPADRIERMARRMARQKLAWSEGIREALELFEANGEREQAAKVALNLAAVFPRKAALQAVAARHLLAVGRPEAAVRRLERAVQLDPAEPKYAAALRRANQRLLEAGVF